MYILASTENFCFYSILQNYLISIQKINYTFQTPQQCGCLYLEFSMSQKIYVGNLGYSVTDTSLATKFAMFGTVESSKVIIDRDTNRSKGFAFVEMSSSSEAADAISGLNGTEFEGRAMNVSEAKPMAPKTNSSRW